MRVNKPDPVKVVTLRRLRAKHEGGGTREVEWTHRWMVSGHWRNQPYKDGVRLRYIFPFVKGPEHLPLVVKETVYALKR
jgi:hypothetical protein